MGKDQNDRLLEGKSLDREGEPWEISPAEPAERPLSDRNGTEEPAPLDWTGDDPAWFTARIPPREWLVRAGKDILCPGFLPRGEVGILAAPGSSGKTWALVALALAVATARPWLGYFTVSKPGRVVFLAAEETENEIRRRIQAQAAMMGINPEKLAGRLLVLDRSRLPPEGPALVRPLDPRFVQLGGELSTFGRRVFDDLQKRAELQGPWDLIVLDPLSAFGPPDCEIDNASATATMRAVEHLCTLPGEPTVLVAHHTRKGAGKDGAPEADDIRGASGLVNRARWAATLQKQPSPWDGVRVTSLQIVKANYSAEVSPLVYLHPTSLPGQPSVGAGGAIREAMTAEVSVMQTRQESSAKRSKKSEEDVAKSVSRVG